MVTAGSIALAGIGAASRASTQGWQFPSRAPYADGVNAQHAHPALDALLAARS
ncbi:MAG TPA: hypothetical protein VKY62_16225 [Devosia sp.]|nr:hypothetical protein [Devosia sp.]